MRSTIRDGADGTVETETLVPGWRLSGFVCVELNIVVDLLGECRQGQAPTWDPCYT